MTLDVNALRLLADRGSWQDLARATEEQNEGLEPSIRCFFRGLAALKLGSPKSALAFIRQGLLTNSQSAWGRKLEFDALLAGGQKQEAFSTFSKFLRDGPGHEAEKAWFVESAALAGELDIAHVVNSERAVIREWEKSGNFAIAVQCFVKSDTLAEVLESLLRLHNTSDISLVLLLDSPKGSGREGEFEEAHRQAKAVLGDYIPRLSSEYFSVQLMENKTNLGTAPTCRRLLDHVSSRFAKFMFIEDDCVLSPSAADWIRHHLDHTIRATGPWFASCESVFFDKEDRELTGETYNRLALIAAHEEIAFASAVVDFVPSTCFGTTREIWKLCASVRSFTRGPESLTAFMRQLNRTTLLPVVPRAADVGMLHNLGYSVGKVGAINIRERKNTFLLAESAFKSERANHLKFDLDLFYAATSGLSREAITEIETRLNLNPQPN